MIIAWWHIFAGYRVLDTNRRKSILSFFPEKRFNEGTRLAFAIAKFDKGLHFRLTRKDTAAYMDDQRCPDKTARVSSLIWAFTIRIL